ncbi:tRNA 2-thiocytidine(32) synthetase TtcA [Gammaproteobacteria bacterium]|nr:tRNA 2-thiocytidine(32) synthetase TtcA [Gammaproteobacteria bacterium]
MNSFDHASPGKHPANVLKLEKRLRRLTGQAIEHYAMIGNGDKVMVCLSGGKDSYTLLELLLRLRQRAPIDFEIIAAHLDQGQPGYPHGVIGDYMRSIDVPYHLIEQDTYSVVKRVIPEGKTTCGLCSRLRRGILYGFAERHGVTRIALGHHRDDIIETFFLNLFHGGTIKAMPAKLKSDDGKNVVIRPLAYCEESDIARYAAAQQYPIVPCNLCGSQENLQRQSIKAMIEQWRREHPGRVESIFAAMSNIAPSQLLDRDHFDFTFNTAPSPWQAEGAARTQESPRHDDHSPLAVQFHA